MTQVKRAQPKPTQIALRRHATLPSLAQRRTAFAVQMRAMALADLEAVAARLKDLHRRLNRKTAHEWTLLEIAQAAGVAPRTFQTWVGAKNENRDGEGYEKLAQFYRRNLEDATITKSWIVFGDEDPEEAAKAPDVMARLGNNGRAELDAIQENQRLILQVLTELKAEIRQALNNNA